MAHAWGYADMARRVGMSAGTLMPICSISKQFTCGVLLDVVGEPSVLDDRVADFLPAFRGRRPGVAELCHNQSGLRDYWALTVLHGAQPEGVFRREDARPLLARMQSGHFEPGSSYSYSNGNFRMLSDMIEHRTGRSLGELYGERIFGPAGMETAALTAGHQPARRRNGRLRGQRRRRLLSGDQPHLLDRGRRDFGVAERHAGLGAAYRRDA